MTGVENCAFFSYVFIFWVKQSLISEKKPVMYVFLLDLWGKAIMIVI